jgi:hypothetical protein
MSNHKKTDGPGDALFVDIKSGDPCDVTTVRASPNRVHTLDATRNCPSVAAALFHGIE